MSRKLSVVVFLFIAVAGWICGGRLLTSAQGPPAPTGSTTITVVDQANQPEFVNAPGWTWLIRPEELKIGRTWGWASGDGNVRTGYSVVDAEGGALRLFFVQSGPSILDSPLVRLVVLDAAGKRYLPEEGDSGGFRALQTNVSTSIFTLNPKALSPKKAAYLAVERKMF